MNVECRACGAKFEVLMPVLSVRCVCGASMALHPREAQLCADIDSLCKENAKLRALVERAIEHIGCSCMECPQVEKECREALK